MLQNKPLQGCKRNWEEIFQCARAPVRTLGFQMSLVWPKLADLSPHLSRVCEPSLDSRNKTSPSSQTVYLLFITLMFTFTFTFYVYVHLFNKNSKRKWSVHAMSFGAPVRNQWMQMLTLQPIFLWFGQPELCSNQRMTSSLAKKPSRHTTARHFIYCRHSNIAF